MAGDEAPYSHSLTAHSIQDGLTLSLLPNSKISEEGSDWPSLGHVSTSGPIMYGLEATVLYFQGFGFQSIYIAAGGGRTPLGGQSGRDEKGSKSHCPEKEGMLETLALSSS